MRKVKLNLFKIILVIFTCSLLIGCNDSEISDKPSESQKNEVERRDPDKYNDKDTYKNKSKDKNKNKDKGENEINEDLEEDDDALDPIKSKEPKKSKKLKKNEPTDVNEDLKEDATIRGESDRDETQKENKKGCRQSSKESQKDDSVGLHSTEVGKTASKSDNNEQLESAPSPSKQAVSESAQKASQEEVEFKLMLSRVAELLQIRVVSEAPGGLAPEIPDASVNPTVVTAMDENITQGSDIQFHNKFYLPDPQSAREERRKNLFFVWPEDSLGRKIVSASFSHRILNSNKQLIGSFEPRQVWHDVDHHRWYIPISKLFEDSNSYSEMDTSLLDTQVIHLDLNLEKGQIAQVNFQFQIEGPLPKIQSEILPISDPDNFFRFIRDVSNSGWTIFREQITNPSSRVLHLGLKSENSSLALWFDIFLNFESWLQIGNRPPDGAPTQFKYSRSKLIVDSVKVTHADGTTEIKELKSDSWSRVVLAPNETLVLEWHLKPSPDTQNCFLPEWQLQHFTWTTLSREAVKILGDYRGAKYVPTLPDPITHSRVLDAKYDYIGGRVYGKWNRQVQIGYPFDLQADSSFLESFEVGSGENEKAIDIPSGSNPSNPSPFSCQGVFR